MAWGGTEGPQVSTRVAGSGRKLSEQAGLGRETEILIVRCVFPGAAGGIWGCPEGRVVGRGGTVQGEVWAGRTRPGHGGGG